METAAVTAASVMRMTLRAGMMLHLLLLLSMNIEMPHKKRRHPSHAGGGGAAGFGCGGVKQCGS